MPSVPRSNKLLASDWGYENDTLRQYIEIHQNHRKPGDIDNFTKDEEETTKCYGVNRDEKDVTFASIKLT